MGLSAQAFASQVVCPVQPCGDLALRAVAPMVLVALPAALWGADLVQLNETVPQRATDIGCVFVMNRMSVSS